MKKLYLIGLLITTLFIVIKIIFVIGDARFGWIISQVLLGYVLAHLYLGFSFLMMNLPRHYYQNWYIKHMQGKSWVVVVLIMGFATVSYLFDLNKVNNAGFLTYGTVMFIIGSLMEIKRHQALQSEEDLKYAEEEPVDLFEKRLLEGQDKRIKY